MPLWRRGQGGEGEFQAGGPAGRSPLGAARYEPESGALDLHRFVESPVDGRVREALDALAAAGREHVGEWRSSLDMDDLYTLLAFVRRSVLAALGSRPEPPPSAGLRALVMVDQQRVDWRDLAVAAELFAWMLKAMRKDHSAILRAAAADLGIELEPAVAAVAGRPTAELQPDGYRTIKTPAGYALATTRFQPYEAEADLVAVAFAVQDVIEDDAYRVGTFTVHTSMLPVWLGATAADAARDALARVRGTVSLDAQLDPAMSDTAAQQQFLAFLNEAASEADAAAIAAAAVSKPGSYEALGIAEGVLCCVLVARSIVEGTDPHEQPDALARFRAPVAAALGKLRSLPS